MLAVAGGPLLLDVLAKLENGTAVRTPQNDADSCYAKMLTKDLGTILVGEMAVKEGLIHEVGGISEALFWLHQEIERRRKRRNYKN